MRNTLIVVVMAIALSSLYACNGFEANAEENYIGIDLGEAGVQFIVDNDNKIISFSANNQEGEELLLDKDYSEQNVFVAIEDVIENSLLLGFLDPMSTANKPNVALVTTEQFKVRTNNRFSSDIQNNIRTLLSDKGIWSVVLNSEDIEELQSLAQEYKITASQARIVKASQDIGEGFSYESIQDYSPQEVARMISEKKPITSKIQDLEKEKTDIENELQYLEENTQFYNDYKADLRYLEKDLASYKAKYELILSKREAHLEENQAKIEAYLEAQEQKIQDLKQSNGNGNYSRELVNLKRAEMGEILK